MRKSEGLKQMPNQTGMFLKKNTSVTRFFKSKIRILALMLIGLTAVFSIIYFTTKETKPTISQTELTQNLENKNPENILPETKKQNKEVQESAEKIFDKKETVTDEIPINNGPIKNNSQKSPSIPEPSELEDEVEKSADKDLLLFNKKELTFQVLPITSVLGNYSFEEPFLEKYKKEDGDLTTIFTSHFALRFSLTPEYTFRKEEINSESQPQIHEDYTLIKAGSESGALSFSLGANLIYYATPQISFKTGLFYDRYSTSLNYSFKNEKIPVIDGKTNEILGYLTDTSVQQTILNQTNHYNYLQVPIVMEYFIPLNNKYEISLKGGAAFLFKTKSSVKTLNYSELVFDENSTDNFQSYNTGIILGVGLWDRSHQRFSYGIEPTYKFFLNSINKDETISSKPYSFGIKTSFEINF
jgi:hypothetical protein